MHVAKPAFEQFRTTLTRSFRPLREKDIVPIEHAVVASLDLFRDLLVEKARRVPQGDTLLEISARWIGLDAHPDEVVKIFREGWDDSVLGAEEARFHALVHDDAVIVAFAAGYPDRRFLTGRLKAII